ncbi:MAG: glycoside hydrolase family 3 protein, partial [Clostridia bacterium]|nr:glycoside hydrolase family 3 protein [Clostridia bacterium]
MDIKNLVQELTFEEKAKLLTGGGSMNTYPIERLSIPQIEFADGPHGTRRFEDTESILFPSLSSLGACWNPETAREMGRALANDCIVKGIHMLLGPGANMKRHILCGRNFEYISEDPVLSGELAAAYIQGLQEKGVSASLKHFAANNQEEYRCYVSAEIDERTLREIYLKSFEIAIKKGKPDTVMCAYNKINGVWCSENPMLLQEILRDEWGYEGLLVSDWGAVQDISRAIHNGCDLQMPTNEDIVEQLRAGLEAGKVTLEDIDRAVARVLRLIDRESLPEIEYDREEQHATARRVSEDSIVLMKNENNVLPITKEKYKKVAVVGDYAIDPMIGGQGSSEVHPADKYIDKPFDALKAILPEIEWLYVDLYHRNQFSKEMMFPTQPDFQEKIKDCDLVVFFAGGMDSDESEMYDRRTAYMNHNYSVFMRATKEIGKPMAVVLQNGSALIFDVNFQCVDAVVEMWFGGEAGGSAVASILSGKVNPSGKLSETFPNTMRRDMEYPGNGRYLEYKERFDVGYRYYDKHPEEIAYPFGHGLS